MTQKCHTYALRFGFIGPLTRKQTKRRIYNAERKAKARQFLVDTGAKPDKNEYDGGSYFDNFVDGQGW